MLSAKGPSRVPTRFRLGYATDELELAGSKYYINIRTITSIFISFNLISVSLLSEKISFPRNLIISIEIIEFPSVNLFNVIR